MTTTPRRALVATVALLAGLVAGGTPLARAADSPAPAPAGPGELTFGVQTSGPQRPDARGLFSWSVTPGATLTDHVAFVNASDRALRLTVYAADALNTPEGGYDLLPAGTRSVDAGSWIRLDRGVVDVPAKGRTIVGFRVRVPLGASPGDHSAGIVASLRGTRVDAQGNQIEVDQRVGARTYLRVAGDLRPELRVEGFTTSYDGRFLHPLSGAATVTWTVHNAGNVRMRASQALQLNPWLGGGRTVGLEDLPEILPGNRLSFTTAVDDVPAGVRLAGALRLDPSTVVPGPGVAPVLAEDAAWAVPWLVVVLLGLVVVVLAARRARTATAPARARGRHASRSLRSRTT